jgi:hypothetical protein
LVSTGDHLQRCLESVGRQIAVGISPADERVKLRHAPIIHRGTSDELLGQHVETVNRYADLLNAPRRHLTGQHSLFEQIVRHFRNEPALALLSDEVPRSPDALQGASHVAR